MVDRNLLREFSVTEDELGVHIPSDEEVWDMITEAPLEFDAGQIVPGKVIRIEGDEVLIDVGFKSEGVVPIDEWSDGDDVPEPGEEVKVLLEEFEDDFGLLLLSKRKADRIQQWIDLIERHQEGDIVTGKVVRKIKGGLLVSIGADTLPGGQGVNVFLPASQVDIRRPQDIGVFIEQDIECVILKIDEARRNIVVSRRKLIEDRRAVQRQELLERLVDGDTCKGVVKNIADFGAFVDLGGIDGLLHITDMSWGRISHPTEMVKIEDEIEVKVLSIDREKQKIALGMKQLTPSPWEGVEEKYPVNEKVSGEVVNVMSYGAFVKLEDGIEGLVHISEMSWVKRINHPTELVQIGDEVEVVVLGINKDKQEISLGMKQTQPNPWDNVTEKYPEDSVVKGTVRNLTNYGAFIELEEGVDGLLHVSDMSWTRKISHANEMLKKGMELECRVISVDEDRKRIALGLKQLSDDPWETTIPERFGVNSIVKGVVTKITNFGVFVELESELEGLLHVSELADHKVDNPESEVKVGEELEVRVLRLDIDDRKIGLTRKLEPDDDVEHVDSSGEARTAAGANQPLKGGIGGGTSGSLFSMPTTATEEETPAEEAPAEEASAEESAESAEAADSTEAAETPTEESTDAAEASEEAPAEEPAAETESGEEKSDE